MITKGGAQSNIGMSEIKKRRLQLPVRCRPGTKVGEYVPFYFCPRSVMLYVIHRGNHPELVYKDGQGPIIHLESDLRAVIAWATNGKRLWAYSLSNAGARYANFGCTVAGLDKVSWFAIQSPDFRDADIKEGKQAEFLVYEMFPWGLVIRIGVHTQKVKLVVDKMLASSAHRPTVEIMPDWYF